MKASVEIPGTVQAVIERGARDLKPEKIVLFGSRARGDHRPNSDFDLAFFQVKNNEDWDRFLVSHQEDPTTLYSLDLLRFDEVDEAYQKNILQEGIVLYEE